MDKPEITLGSEYKLPIQIDIERVEGQKVAYFYDATGVELSIYDAEFWQEIIDRANSTAHLSIEEIRS